MIVVTGEIYRNETESDMHGGHLQLTFNEKKVMFYGIQCESRPSIRGFLHLLKLRRIQENITIYEKVSFLCHS